VTAERALLRHHLRSIRRGSLIWAFVFALLVVTSAAGYRTTYETPAERLVLVHTLGENAGLQAIFGHAYALDTVGGFTAWRAGGLLALAGGIWGLLVATRLMRGEEEEGRFELVLAGTLRPARAAAVVLVALAAGAFTVFVGATIGALLGGSGSGGWSAAQSLYCGMALTMPVVVFMAVGALWSQLAGARRLAAALAGGTFGVAFLLRVAADSSPSAEWLRSFTPLGWAEQLRPLTGEEPLALLPLLALIALLCAASLLVAGRRDLGSSPIRAVDERPPRLTGLSSVPGQVARTGWLTAAGWAASLGIAAFIFGLISKGVAKIAEESPSFQRAASHIRGANLLTAGGYVGVTFLMIMAALSVLVATEISAAREEEASERLDELLVRPVGRREWLASRLGVGLAFVGATALSVALFGFLGTVAAGADVGIVKLLEGALNCIPVPVFYMGLGTLALGLIPRAAPPVALGLVAGLFLLELLGSAIGLPDWLLWLSPFDHVAFVPGGSIDVAPALIMAGIGALAALGGIEAFARRDLVPA
jgi:polyether ionophore transport system permease protein